MERLPEVSQMDKNTEITLLTYLESQAEEKVILEWNGYRNGKTWNHFAILSGKPSTRESDAGMEWLPQISQMDKNTEILLLSYLESRAQEKVILRWTVDRG